MTPSSTFDGASGNLAAGSFLERGKLSQALLNVCAVLIAFLLILVTGLGTAASLFILFFVST
ncbi:hypothetical protein [Bradyrhizobium sp. SZCCHNS2015]|uniref:hypothetical protein n=1 Tax=Bradyrhizobium sp. SZCCHNS2015 TaxID=3057305 RepID=UPI0028EEA3B6|nr:hypothetical protein [Bradyrhizobium sp. SZCCHNS2015]